MHKLLSCEQQEEEIRGKKVAGVEEEKKRSNRKNLKDRSTKQEWGGEDKE